MPTATSKRLTVIGTGNAALTAAYHFSLCGGEVCLYGAPGFDEPLGQIRSAGGVRALDSYGGAKLLFPGFQPIARLTNRIGEAVAHADILLLPVPSFAQEILFSEMLPHLRSGQIIVLMPGNCGSLVFQRLKNETGRLDLDVTFVDAVSIPWACRITGPAEIAIFGMKRHLPVATLPASSAERLIRQVQRRFPLPLTPLQNVVAAGLDNINFGAHPLMTLLNIGLLENFPDRFNYYHDCCSLATARATAAMEEERLAVGRALGLRLVPELEAMNSLYGLDCKSVYEFNRSSPTHKAIQSSPRSSDHRYLTEDVPYLLVPCHEFGRLAGTPTPVVDACILLAGALNGADYLRSGRTLAAMGLAGYSLERLRGLLAGGGRR